MYLEEKLGVATFQKVYAYVSREENGEQESGEREAVLALLPSRRISCRWCAAADARTAARTAARPAAQPAPPPSPRRRPMRDGRAQRLLGQVHTLVYLQEALDG